MKLGDLIDTLTFFDPTMPVRFDCAEKIGSFASWRGDYAQLTLTPSSNWDMRKPALHTVGDLLDAAKAADGATFHGYKGGDYMMGRTTPLWADEWGEYTARGIIGVIVDDGTVVLTTADLSDYI